MQWLLHWKQKFSPLILCLERKAVRLVKLFIGTVAFSTTKQQHANSIVLRRKKSSDGEPQAWILVRSLALV